MCSGNLIEDNPDVLLGRIDRLHCRIGQFGDERTELLRAATLGESHLDQRHCWPPDTKIDPSVVKWKAIRAAGPAATASVMPPVKTN